MNVLMAITAGVVAIILAINLISGSAEKAERSSLGIAQVGVVPVVSNQPVPNLRKLIAKDISGNVNVRTSLTDAFAPISLVSDLS